MSAHSLLNGKCFCVVTGASQGFGRDLAIAVAKEVGAGSAMMIVARNSESLQETAKLINAETPDLDVLVRVFDLSQVHLLTKNWLVDSVKELDKGDLLHTMFDSTIIFHAAGSLGDVSTNMSDGYSSHELQAEMNLNVISPIVLSTAFLEAFPQSTASRAVVNISSMAAVQPFASWGTYCITRSAKEMSMRVLAAETKDVRVLNYAPGPMVTAMTKIAAMKTKDDNVRGFFEKMMEDGSGSVKINDTLARLMNILQKNTFETGSHVDYFDKLE